MGMNITTQTMNSSQFENRDNLRNAAKDILNKQTSSKETVQNIVDRTIFDVDGKVYPAAQLAIIKASSQISMNGKLKETLKYLKSNPVKKHGKEPVLGELWNLFNSDESGDYDEIDEIEIDFSMKNIFAAA